MVIELTKRKTELFETKLLAHLSHKVCRILSSPDSLLRPPFFSGELLFFSFYCEGVWGWCLMPLGEPGSVTPLFTVPFFFLQEPVDWFGWVPLIGFSWLPSKAHLWHLSVSPCTFHTPIYCQWVNVAKCEYGAGVGFNIFDSSFPIVNHFAHVALLLLHFLLPALPSLWVFFGKYLRISLLKVSV